MLFRYVKILFCFAIILNPININRSLANNLKEYAELEDRIYKLEYEIGDIVANIEENYITLSQYYKALELMFDDPIIGKKGNIHNWFSGSDSSYTRFNAIIDHLSNKLLLPYIQIKPEFDIRHLFDKLDQKDRLPFLEKSVFLFSDNRNSFYGIILSLGSLIQYTNNDITRLGIKHYTKLLELNNLVNALRLYYQPYVPKVNKTLINRAILAYNKFNDARRRNPQPSYESSVMFPPIELDPRLILH